VRGIIGGVEHACLSATVGAMEGIGTASRDGDLAWMRLVLDGGRIEQAEGEGPGVAGLLADLPGLTPLEAAAIPGEPLASDALHEALAPLVSAPPDAARVAVAMSGGVDSAVSLLRARAHGYEPVGVTLRLWLDPRGPDAERVCCSPDAVIAARATCHGLGVPHVTLDLREEFRRAIVAPFVAAYARGETPNPCIRCNGGFRFAELAAFARRIGAARLATGHYARIAEHRGRLLLARAADAEKDQSYMLARLDPRHLGRLWFPLGDSRKDDVRAEARAAGLGAAARAESQEACFLAGGDYRDFLARQGLVPAEGSIEDEAGREVGRHSGFWRFTPGQRKGLGVVAPEPVYALRTEAGTNTVVVGPRESLARRTIGVGRGRLYVDVERADAKLRYRSAAAPARVTARTSGFRLDLDRPAYGVAPGQAAVLYEGDAVVGAGLVSSAR
jgi:tRNA-specific 2-thiouridylase